jgi:hypothetical protein
MGRDSVLLHEHKRGVPLGRFAGLVVIFATCLLQAGAEQPISMAAEMPLAEAAGTNYKNVLLPFANLTRRCGRAGECALLD